MRGWGEPGMGGKEEKIPIRQCARVSGRGRKEEETHIRQCARVPGGEASACI